MQHRKDVLKLAGNTGMRLLGIAFSCLPRVAGRSGILAGGYQANLKKSGYRKKHCRN